MDIHSFNTYKNFKPLNWVKSWKESINYSIIMVKYIKEDRGFR